MDRTRPNHIEFYGTRIPRATHPELSPRGDRALIPFVSLPCRSRNFQKARECDAVLLFPLNLGPTALLCTECYAIHLLEARERSTKYDRLTEWATRFRALDQQHVAYRFPIRYLANGGEHGFTSSLEYIKSLCSVIENDTSGGRVLTAPRGQAPGQVMYIAHAEHDLEHMDNVKDITRDVLVPTIPKIIATVGPEVGRGYAERARTLFPILPPAREAHWNSMHL